MGLSRVEERDYDVVVITQAVFLWNASVAPSYRVAPRWALGLRGSWGSDAGARATCCAPSVAVTRSLWQLGVEARHQSRDGLGGYFAVTGGAAAFVDSVGSASVTQWAPALGGAVGYDFGVAESFALGLELRGGVAQFGEDGAVLVYGTSRDQIAYGTSSWLGLNIVGHFCFSWQPPP